MARKKKQPDLKSLHEETQKALNKLHEDMQKEAPNEIIASKDIVLSLVRHKDGKVELLVKGYEQYPEIFLKLLLKGAYLALVIDNMPVRLSVDYADRLTEAQNDIMSLINTELSKEMLEEVQKKMDNLV